MSALSLPERPGPEPLTRGPIPHGQLDQTAPTHLQEELWGRMRSLPGVYVAPTHVPYPEARAVHLAPEFGTGPEDAFIKRAREFAHMHPVQDSSLHMTLPATVKKLVTEAGWGVPHPIQNTQLVYGPRDRDEIEVVWGILLRSYDYARGSAVDH
ncbi:luciferase domain-containing protein [Actinopolyspora erythraea]|uniref:luciferase domain-containing protein n=1 Tax=Actinopolyspora erythraea TaxID=414996 RepID=UPI0005B92EBD|nr:luciferase family protein [Actinopolyspora erythraea]